MSITKSDQQLIQELYEEVKALRSVEILLPIHEAQIISYLKSTGLTAGLLIKRFIWTNNY